MSPTVIWGNQLANKSAAEKVRFYPPLNFTSLISSEKRWTAKISDEICNKNLVGGSDPEIEIYVTAFFFKKIIPEYKIIH